jgi:nucleotide-binding universal stress UspA family protein
MFKRILVPIDGSTCAKQAIPIAIEVAQKFQSDVLVLHVSEHDSNLAVAYSPETAVALSHETPAEASELVADAMKVIRDARIYVRGELRDAAVGQVAKVIVETANDNRIDLIVMRSRGLSDLQGLLLGSVTHKVIQLANIPVLVDSTRAVRERSTVAAVPTYSPVLRVAD